jgi:hypothetical protein
MSDNLKAVIRAILLAIIGFIVSRALLEVVQALGWYPEDQLANLLLKSPDLWKVAWVRWILIAFVAVILGGLADYILYRRRLSAYATITQPSPTITAPCSQLQSFSGVGSLETPRPQGLRILPLSPT